jgi:hypothetical protein
LFAFKTETEHHACKSVFHNGHRGAKKLAIPVESQNQDTFWFRHKLRAPHVSGV